MSDARTIIRKVAARTGVPLSLIMSRKRTRPVAHARQRLMFALRMSPFTVQRASVGGTDGWTRSYPHIGQMLGRDHTTVIHGVRAEAARRGVKL